MKNNRAAGLHNAHGQKNTVAGERRCRRSPQTGIPTMILPSQLTWLRGLFRFGRGAAPFGCLPIVEQQVQ